MAPTENPRKRTAGHLCLCAAMVVALGAAVATGQGSDWRQSQGIDDGRQWVEGSRPSPTSPALIRAAATVAFNETEVGIQLLRGLIQSQPRSDAASQAYELLSRVYLRSGQYRRLIENLDAWNAQFPDRDEVRREQRDIEQLRGLPDQVNGPRRASILHHDGGIVVPVVINGTSTRAFFDTGAWISAVGQAEATRLGLEIRGGTGTLSDASGLNATTRFAVAKDVSLGSMRFRHVSFAVLPSQENALEGPTPSVAILGMPILLAAETIRWSKDGTAEFGLEIDRGNRAASNLVFYRNRLLLRTSAWGQFVFGTLDTGALSTDLNSNFATQFADLVQRTGTRDRQSITGVGGTTVTEAIRLPEVVFDISGVSAALRPVSVTLQRNPGLGGDCCIGNIGLDLLTAAGAFTIDLSGMTLRLQ